MASELFIFESSQWEAVRAAVEVARGVYRDRKRNAIAEHVELNGHSPIIYREDIERIAQPWDELDDTLFNFNEAINALASKLAAKT